MTPRVQRAVAIGLPVFCLIGAALIVTPSWRQLNEDREKVVKVRKEILSAQQNVELLKNAPKGPPFAHVPATRTEPIEFLQHLNEVTAQCGVRLARYKQVVEAPKTADNPPPPPVPGLPNGSNGAPAANGERGGLPPGITPASLRLTVEGDYAHVALFFNRLESYPRLVSITEVAMRAAKATQISAEFTLTRYTTPEQPVTAGSQ